MNKLLDTMRSKNITCGYLYFYIHFVTEVACFFYLSKVLGNSLFIWLVPLIYDGMAFVPQAVIGYINDKYNKISFGLVGTFLIFISYVFYFCMELNLIISLILLCIGNACIHINGAEVTLKASLGKLSHSAIFVAGGSFGVITGKLLANSIIPFWVIGLWVLSMIPFIILAENYNNKNNNCNNFNYNKKNIKPMTIIVLTVLVVLIRGYIGYGIPTSWNKTTIQTILLFSMMGIGKALGGILSDSFGIRKVAIASTVLSIPFLCFGDKIMIVSLIGVMLFSMTMAITLAILVSTLKKNPGLAFGFTTIGLFLGTLPIFFIKITNKFLNLGFIVFLSLLCAVILMRLLTNKGDKTNELDI